MDLKNKIINWYEGEYSTYENDPNSSIAIIGGYYVRHWTANIARSLVSFYLNNWKWLWMFGVSTSGLFLAVIKL